MLTQEALKKKFSYNRNTGIFTRVNSKRIKIGTIVAGYLIISIDYIRYPAQRLAWLYEYGEFPNGYIDHKNHIKLDNTINNLRDVTPLENVKSTKLYRCNKSGYHGVIWDKVNNNWRARIGVEGKTLNLGSFTDKDDAITARKAAEVKYEFHSNHGINKPFN